MTVATQVRTTRGVAVSAPRVEARLLVSQLAGAGVLVSAVMAAVVLATRGWVGEWTAINGAVARVGWLLLAIAAGAASYGLALVALGLRPRHLRH